MPTVYITAPPERADTIARTLVEERLAACVNRVPCQSVYRWDGEIHDEAEIILLAKTTTATTDALVDRVEELHPYDVPCIEQFEQKDVTVPFASWVEASTT